jgi:hypothetical protein
MGMEQTGQMIGWQQIVAKDAGEELRQALHEHAMREMRRCANGAHLDPDGPTRRESDLVWLDNWGEHGEYVSVEIARTVGVTTPPTTVLMRWDWRVIEAA